MKRYCKNVDITDINFITRCIYLWLEGKIGRYSVQHFLSQYSAYSHKEIRNLVYIRKLDFLDSAVQAIAIDIKNRLTTEELDLPEIQQKLRYDVTCMKTRTIGIQRPLHQVLDYIATEGCSQLFRAKIGFFQIASIKGKGSSFGVRWIYRWLRTDPKRTRYYAKADVYHCYPTINHDKIKARFMRDLKNPKLLWLVCKLIDQFPEGLSLGSHFSQYACNYYLSTLYHYITEQLAKTRKKKNGKTERVRLLSHCLFYMDDILILGSSKKDLEQAMNQICEFTKTELGLKIKSDWFIRQTDYIGKSGERKGHFIDMMGYRIYRDHITIRRRTFKRMRRAFLRASWRIKNKKHLSLIEAQRVVSYAGILSQSNSRNVKSKYHVAEIMRESRRVISAAGRAGELKRRRAKDVYESMVTQKTRGSGVSQEQRFDRRSVDSGKYPHGNHCRKPWGGAGAVCI